MNVLFSNFAIMCKIVVMVVFSLFGQKECWNLVNKLRSLFTILNNFLTV